jgi:hypothetical protein
LENFACHSLVGLEEREAVAGQELADWEQAAGQYVVEEIQACMTGGGPADGIQDVLVNPPANARGFSAADSVEQGGQEFGREIGEGFVGTYARWAGLYNSSTQDSRARD